MRSEPKVESHGFESFARSPTKSPRLYWRLRRPDHHGRGRGSPASAVEGKKGRGRARRPVRRPPDPARRRDRAVKPALVREEHRAGRHGGSAAGVSPGTPVDGGNPGRAGGGDGGAVFEAKFMLPWNFSEEAAA